MSKQPYVLKTVATIFFLTLALFVLSTQSSLWDRDEPLFARTAYEMLQSGDWLLPTMNGKPFAHKPPLAFWAMAAAMGVLGATPTAARLPAVLSLATAGWMVFLLGRRLFSPRVGYWACAILMSSFMAMYLGSTVMVDMPLLALISLAMWAHLKAISRPQHAYRYWPVLALALGLAELTKHPIGMATVMPATLISTWILRKDLGIPKGYWLGLMAAFAVGYGLHQSWFAAVRNATPGFANEMIGRHIVGRLFTVVEGHGAANPLGYALLLPVYIPIVLVGFAPWSVFLSAGAAALVRRRGGHRTALVFLASWALPVFVGFSLAATKLPHYILPVFPPAALLAAAALEIWRTGRADHVDRRWLNAGAWVMTPLTLTIGVSLCLVVFFFGKPPWRMGAMIPGTLIAGLSLLVFHQVKKDRVVRAARILLVAMPLLMLVAARLTLPVFEPLIKVSPLLAETIRADRRIHEPVAMCGYAEPSFIFYMNLPADQSIALLNPDRETLWEWLRVQEPGWLVVYDSLWREVTNRFGPVHRVQTRRVVPVLNTNDRARRDRVRIVQRLPR